MKALEKMLQQARDDFLIMLNDSFNRFEAEPNKATHACLHIRVNSQAHLYLMPYELMIVQERYKTLAGEYRG